MDKQGESIAIQNDIKKDLESFEKIVSEITGLCERNNWHLAVWRLPYHEEIQLIIDTEPPQPFDKLDFSQKIPAFAIAPFKADDQNLQYLIKSDIYINSKDQSFSSPSGKVDIEKFNQVLSEGFGTKENKKSSGARTTTLPEQLNPTNKEDYLKLVEKSIEYIDWGRFEKVVPSRVKQIELEGLNLSTLYKKLTEEYPRAFVYMVSGPKVGSWIGATPELLMEIEDNRVFRTVSLAGTQPYSMDMDLGNVAWKQKEIEEQAFVSRYIINCFKKIRLREFEEKGPKTAIAGNLIHLKTTFEVDMEATGFSNLGTIMLELLHPTSAVCGMPKEEALTFLTENEPHERKLYSGFIGPVNFNNDSHIFVNLRCMEITENCVNLYAGAGITEHSIPENEWNETELKIDTLLSILKDYLK